MELHRQKCFKKKNTLANRISCGNNLLENADCLDLRGWTTHQKCVPNASVSQKQFRNFTCYSENNASIWSPGTVAEILSSRMGNLRWFQLSMVKTVKEKDELGQSIIACL